MANILNRPYINRSPVEGPEPFTWSMTLTEGMRIGAITEENYQTDNFTIKQLEALYAFRCLYPIDLGSNEPVIYPPEESVISIELASRKEEA